MRLAASLITLGACYALAAASTTVPSALKCRVCNNAKNLGDCTTDVRCDANEDCFMESVITDQLEIVYNGGCRATDVCQSTTSGLFGKRNADDEDEIHIGKRDFVVACSKCCDSSTGCNTKLCGIENKLIDASLCYFCDHSLSTQSEVEHPADCSTHTVCQHDEFCYAGKYNTAGVVSFQYGCKKKNVCRFLMNAVFEEFDRCYNSTDATTCGGNLHNRAPTPLCHACCGYGECNYGSCYDINERNYLYYKKGLWDKTELKPMTGVTTTVLPKTTPATTTPTTTTTTTPTTTPLSSTKTTTPISSPTPPPTTQPQPPTTSTQPPPTTTTIATSKTTPVAPSPASAQPANTPTGANSPALASTVTTSSSSAVVG